MKLTEQEKKKIIELIEAGKPLPVIYKAKLFDSGETEFIEATKDYKLVYKGKARKEEIIAQTPAAPFQLIRTFNNDNPFEDDWRNKVKGTVLFKKTACNGRLTWCKRLKSKPLGLLLQRKR